MTSPAYLMPLLTWHFLKTRPGPLWISRPMPKIVTTSINTAVRSDGMFMPSKRRLACARADFCCTFSVRTAERCQQLSHGYAFLAYPWYRDATRIAPRQGCEESSHACQGTAVFGPDNLVVRSLLLA